jgi:hypothetical protein
MDKLASVTIRRAHRSLRTLHSSVPGGLRAEASSTETAATPTESDSSSSTAEASSSSSSSTGLSSQRPVYRPRRTDFTADYDNHHGAPLHFQFDDATSLGWLRLEKIRETQELFRKVAADRDVLAGESCLDPYSLSPLTCSTSESIQTPYISSVHPYTEHRRSLQPGITTPDQSRLGSSCIWLAALFSRCDSPTEAVGWSKVDARTTW